MIKTRIFFMIVFNTLIIYAFSGLVYSFIGIPYTALSLILTLLTLIFGKSEFYYFIIGLVLKKWKESKVLEVEGGEALLLSCAFLIGVMKIGAAIGVFVLTGATILIAFTILLVSGYFFEGKASGMTATGAYLIARIAAKITWFLTSIFDNLMEMLIKLQMKLLGIEGK